MAKKKNKINVVYSTNPDFEFEYDNEEMDTLPPNEQQLRVQISKKQRAGKTATLVTGFIGTSDDLKDLCKTLKNKCGVGGSAKNDEIIIQGDLKDKIKNILIGLGYKNTK